MIFSDYLELTEYGWKRLVIQSSKIVYILSYAIATLSTAYADNNKLLVSQHYKTIPVPVLTIQTDKEFDDIIEDLLIVIAENNFRLTQHSRIGKTIAKRNNISFPHATVIHFCNLDYARSLLEVAPDYLLRMPCRISIMPKEKKGATIEAWLLPEDDNRTVELAKKINAILINIMTYGAR